MEWNNMSSAPHDGTLVLLAYRPAPDEVDYEVGAWIENYGAPGWRAAGKFIEPHAWAMIIAAPEGRVQSPLDEAMAAYPAIPKLYLEMAIETAAGADMFEHPWCTVYVTDDNEITVNGCPDKAPLLKEAEAAELACEGVWRLELILHDGVPVPFKVERQVRIILKEEMT